MARDGAASRRIDRGRRRRHAVAGCLLLSSPFAALAAPPANNGPMNGSGDSHLIEVPPAKRAETLTQRPDEKQPDEKIVVELYGRPLTIGGEVEMELERRRDFEFDTEPDSLDRIDGTFKLEFLYELAEQRAVFVEAGIAGRHDAEPESGEHDGDSYWRRGELWFYSGGWFDDRVSYQIGRQNFNDDREWWWDEDLDAVRIHYNAGDTQAEIALAQELGRENTDAARIHPEEDKVLRLLASVTREIDRRNERSLFLLAQYDHSDTEAVGTFVHSDLRDESDLDALWLGWRAQGRWKLPNDDRLYYWLDSGAMWGNERAIDYDPVDGDRRVVDGVEQRRVRGAALDLGLNWQTSLPGRLTFTAGYAVGSGDDDPDDGVDGNYRQSGMQDNDDKFRGVTGFRYYGDLLRPELSNIAITTFAAGFRFLGQNSLDLVFHGYRQLRPMDEIRDARLDYDPDGVDTDIGSEINLVLGIEEIANWEIELVASRFRAGTAYGARRGETAEKLGLEIFFRF